MSTSTPCCPIKQWNFSGWALHISLITEIRTLLPIHVLSCSLLLQTIPSAMFCKVWNFPMLFAPGIKLSGFFSHFSFNFSLLRLRTGQRVELLSGRWCNSLQPRIGQLSYPARVGRVSWEVSLRRAKRAHRGLQQVGCILISFYSSLQLLEVFNV